MDSTTATQAAPQPKLLSRADGQEIGRLYEAQKVANRALPSGATSSADYQKALQNIKDKAKTLDLPTCPIKYTVWTQCKEKDAEPTCLQFLFVVASLPAPQLLLSAAYLPKEGRPLSSLDKLVSVDPERPFFRIFENGFDLLGNSSNEERAYGWFVENKQNAFKEKEVIDLKTQGKDLAQKWLLQLQQAQQNSQSHNNLYSNLKLLISTLAAHRSCSFTEAEFAPFKQAIYYSPAELSQWTNDGFICSNFRSSLTHLVCGLVVLCGLGLALSYVPQVRRWAKTVSH